MLKWVLVGDGDSPHLLKWAQALSQQPRVQVWAVSSRGFSPEWADWVPAARRLALNTQPRFEGGNAAVLRHLPTVGRWLREVDADVLHAHYLTSHGGLLALAQRLYGLRGRLLSSAWGSDVLVTPGRSALHRAWTAWILRRSVACTSDSADMAERMRALGARHVAVFYFGLMDALPAPQTKDPFLCFANRALEPIYRPERVLAVFARWAAHDPRVRLVVAHTGRCAPALQRQVRDLNLQDRVRFVGRLSTAEQAAYYAQATWYFSLPQSDSVSVSVIEALSHGCVPVLSDLPANEELLQQAQGVLLAEDGAPTPPLRPGAVPRVREAELPDHVRTHAALWPQAAAHNRACVAQWGPFSQSVQAWVNTLFPAQSAV